MTLYNNRTFTVAPSGSYDQAHAMCRQHGHMQPDQRGKCLRCGEKAQPRACSPYGRSVVEDIMDRAEALARSDAEATDYSAGPAYLDRILDHTTEYHGIDGIEELGRS